MNNKGTIYRSTPASPFSFQVFRVKEKHTGHSTY